MKVFVTGASGFIGSEIVKKLVHNGHKVIGLARSENSVNKVKDLGAAPLVGDLENLEIIKQGVSMSDGIIHTAFIHDFNQYSKANEVDGAVIKAMGNAIRGTTKPLVVTAGILGLPKMGDMITEESKAINSPRGSEAAAMALADEGMHVSIVRLPPSVHDSELKGFIPFMIGQAHKHGFAAYKDDGQNRWTAVHRKDAVSLFCLALEKADKGALYNAVAEEGVAIKSIAKLISQKLQIPLKSVSGKDADQFFEWMAMFVGIDSPATARKTKEKLNWQPKEIGLLDEMEQHYFVN